MAERDGKFAIAIICALALELDAVIKLLDGLPEIVPHERRDTIFLSAMFAGHPVLLVKPQQYGKLDAALAMQCLQQRFGEMELTILVGVCGGVAQPYGDGPSAPAPIFLGDVVIGNSIVHYIHAAGINPQGLQMKSAAPQVAGTKLRQLLGYLETEYYMQQVTAQSAAILEQHFRDAEYRCPGESEDLAFSSSYHHLHRRCCPTGCCTSNPPMFCSIAKATPCSDLDCDLEQARRRPTYSQVPRRIHVGTYASDDVVMRDPQVRDLLAKNSNVIAFEMEASGIWQLNATCLVIKSVSDYGDSHKHKHWQNYAAACAAATTKAVVEHFYPRDSLHVHNDPLSSPPRLGEWAQAAIQKINSQRHAPSTVAMLESGNTDLASDVMQSFVHTKAFQSWLQGQKSMLVATFCHGSSAAETDNQRQLPGNSTAISLARNAAQSRRGCRVFYVDCAGTFEKRPLTRLHKLTTVQQLQPDPSEIDSSLAAANAALGLLFLQIFCSQPRQEQLLLEYMAELPQSAVAELQSALLDTGRPPTEAMIPVILYMLGRANWTESLLAIDNMELIGVSDQRRLLADIEVLCTALNTRACVAASSDLKGIIKEAAHLYVSEDTEYKEFLASLHFPDMEARRMHVSAATAETNSWIWSNPEYVAFSRQQSGILWIRGKPGSGKSVLAKFIKETLLERLRSTQGPTGSGFLVGDWFYHRRGGGPHVQHYSLLRSILYHLSKQSRDVFTSFCLAAYRSMDPRNISWSGDTLKQMILRVCHGPMPVICVVDAVDEAENSEVLSVIRAFAEDTSSSNAKFIILSRPAVAIEQQVAGYHSIVMERENHGDIEKIVCKGLESLRQALHALDLGALPSAECAPRTRGQPRGSRMKQPRSRSVGVAMLHEQLALQEIQNTLIENAQGSVLWVKLVLDQLIRQASSPWTCTLDGLRQAVKRIPHELEEYYTQIVVEMQRQQPAEDIEAIRRMLMWICAAGEIGEVTLEMLSEVMAIIKDNFSSFTVHDIRSSRPLFESWDELWRKMHLTCGVFIEIYNPGLSVEESRDYNYGAASVVQLMHQSVRDFLTESPAAAQLSFTLAEAREFVQSHLSDYLRITGQCLRSRDSGGESFRCIELLEYLDDWKLLELALLQQHSAAAAFDFRVPPLQEPTPQSPDSYLCAALLSNVHTFEDLSGIVNGASQPGVQNTSNCMEWYLPANRLFYRACKDGLVTAVLNMLALGWHRDMAYMDSGPVVMYGVILAASTCQCRRVHVDCIGKGISNDTNIDGKSGIHTTSGVHRQSDILGIHDASATQDFWKFAMPGEDFWTPGMPLPGEQDMQNAFTAKNFWAPAMPLPEKDLQDAFAAENFWTPGMPLPGEQDMQNAFTAENFWTLAMPPPGERGKSKKPPGEKGKSKKPPGEKGKSKKPKSSQGTMTASPAGYQQTMEVSRVGRALSAVELGLKEEEERRRETEQEGGEARRREEKRRRETEQGREEARRREENRFDVDDEWVSQRWHVTVWVDGDDSLLPWGATSKSSGWTSRFREWSGFLDLTCGTMARVLQQQGKWGDDDDVCDGPLPEDVEQAITVAIRGAKRTDDQALK